MDQSKELWAIVELFGHQRIAGKVSEQVLGGNFLRVDVPQTKDEPAWTRFLNPSAVYAINPCSEEVATAVANQLKVKPINIWDAAEIVKRIESQRLEQKSLKESSPSPDLDGDDEEEEEEEEYDNRDL